MRFSLLSIAALAASVLAVDLQQVLSTTPMLSNLTAYVSLYPKLLATLEGAKNVTILAPSNDAFAKLMSTDAGAALTSNDTNAIQALLMYHILNGTYNSSMFMETPMFIETMLMDPAFTNVTKGQVVEAVMQDKNVTIYSGLLNMATVTKADLNFTGGVIHVIDTVLTIPQNDTATATAANLTSLNGALQITNLTMALDTMKDVTIFAPMNEAFQNIASTLAKLDPKNITSILEYHVVNGTVGYSTMLHNMSLTTLEGADVSITVANGSVFVNSAKVILPNVLIANGVVHVIDNVLNPANAKAKPNATESTQMPAFSGASSGTMVPFTSGQATPTSTIVAPTGNAASGAGSQATSTGGSSGGSGSSSSKAGAAVPMKTGAVGAAMLFGAGAALMNV